MQVPRVAGSYFWLIYYNFRRYEGENVMKGIPNSGQPQRYESRNFINSKFVEIKTSKCFNVQMQYPMLGMKNAEKQCWVREEVFEMLLKAVVALPNGYRFKIFDAWRPFALQHELYTFYSASIVRDFKLEAYTHEQKRAVIKKFVSEPIADREIPPVHTTGGAIDLTIETVDGMEIDMGTRFDAFTDKTKTAYFENEMNVAVRENRRLLFNIMTGVGFTNFPSEWWHFDYGDCFWAFYNKKPAIYGGVFTREEIYV